MEAIRTLTSTAAPLPLPNIDTDQIIPKQFLKRIERTGYEDFLFYDWRRIQEGPHAGEPNPDFVLNRPEHKGAKILIAEKNFGCGSSREHAAWAIQQFGFRAVIAPSFADIFANNSSKNGFLTVTLREDEVAELMRRAHEPNDYKLTVDLEQCKVHDDHGFSASFPMDDFVRHCLLEGLDDIGLTLQHESKIAAYEAVHPNVWDKNDVKN